MRPSPPRLPGLKLGLLGLLAGSAGTLAAIKLQQVSLGQDASSSVSRGGDGTADCAGAAPKRNSPFFDARVIRNKPLGDNTRLVRLALPSPEARMSYSVGTYVEICGLSLACDESFPFGKFVVKPFLPVQRSNTSGFVDVIVRMYASPQGDMSRYLASRREGEIVQLRGPVTRPGVDAKLYGARHFGVVAAGSGMTAAIQCVRALVDTGMLNSGGSCGIDPHDPDDERVCVSIVCSAQGPEDLFYIKELERLSKKYPGKINIHRTLTRKTPKGWEGDTGRVSTQMLSKYLPDPDLPGTRIVVCGPDSFCEHVAGKDARPNQKSIDRDQLPEEMTNRVGGLLQTCGYHDDQVVVL